MKKKYGTQINKKETKTLKKLRGMEIGERDIAMRFYIACCLNKL